MARVTGVWADVDSVWEQKKLEATLREMLDCPKGVPHAVPSGGSPQRPVHALFGVSRWGTVDPDQ